MIDVKKWAKWIAIILAVVFLLTSILPVFANPSEEQLRDVQWQMQEQKRRAAQAQRQIDSVAEQLKVIQVSLDDAMTEYKSVQARLTATEKQIAVNTEILRKAEKELAERTVILNNRMRDIYKNGRVNYIDVLFGASDFNDFSNRMEILKRVLQQDLALIAKVKAERELVLQKKAELEAARAEIVELKQRAVDKKLLIEQRKQERENVMASATSQRDTAEKAYNELQETSRQIEQMLRGSGRSRGAETTGAMLWPTSGPITSPFGWRIHPIFGTERFHSGIDIGADYGDAVVAADGGVVVHSDWMGGYGKAVIVDHGGGISTLYAHNSSLLVSEGQVVRKGQSIALVGSTGYSTGPHLHFEVRQNGTPVSPMNYLP